MEDFGLYILTCKGSLASLYINSNLPIFFSLHIEVIYKDFSYFQLLGMTIFNKSLIKPFFNIKSCFVVALSDGEALISINHGFKFLSIKMSNPYNSKQCLSFNIIP